MLRKARPTSCVKAKVASQSGVQIVVEDAADAAHLVAVLEEEILVAPFLVFVVGRDAWRARRRPLSSRRGRRACRDRPACGARSSTGVRSAPPPNQAFVVTTKRVFMCTAGTCGFCRCAISEMPEAQKRGSLGGAGNLLAEFRRELAVARSSSARRPSRTRGRSSSTSRRRRPARRYDRCASTACARSGRRALAKRRCRRQRVLERLERRADVVAQVLEPGARARLAGFDWMSVHHLIPSLAFTAPRSEAVKPRAQSRSNSATAAS